jgi:hypothetical protein
VITSSKTSGGETLLVQITTISETELRGGLSYVLKYKGQNNSFRGILYMPIKKITKLKKILQDASCHDGKLLSIVPRWAQTWHNGAQNPSPKSL